VLDAFSRSPTIDTGVMRALIEQANLAVVARQSESSALSAMRTTVVLVAIDIERNEMAWAHCGDSRAYLFRRGAMVARTKDHSLVQQLVASGMLDDEGARLHPTRNVLLAALGSVDEPLMGDLWSDDTAAGRRGADLQRRLVGAIGGRPAGGNAARLTESVDVAGTTGAKSQSHGQAGPR
jgi:serine/threonine protein phosphatase PrpC